MVMLALFITTVLRQPAAPGAPAYTPAADTTIVIRVGRQLKFTPAELTLREGTRVRLRLMNEGPMPHNLVVAKRADDVDVIATAAQRASATGSSRSIRWIGSLPAAPSPRPAKPSTSSSSCRHPACTATFAYIPVTIA